jgi:hypothetical protein
MLLMPNEVEEKKRKAGLVDTRTPSEAIQSLLIPEPLTPTEQANEKYGKGETIMRRLGNLLTGGLFDSALMPELSTENRAKYETDLDLYKEQQKLALNAQLVDPFQQMLADDDDQNDMKALQNLAVLQPEIYGPVLRDINKNKFAPNPATYTEGEYQFDPAKGEWYLEQQSSAGGIQKTYMGPEFIPRSRMPGAEYIDKSIDTADKENFRANSAIEETGAIISRMDEIGEDNWLAGVAGKGSEFIKNVMGTEDFVTAVRKQYSDIKVRSAINNLPPGVASDRDIQLVLEPWPEDTSNWKLIRDKLEAIQKLERGRAEYARFESRWLASKGTRRGLQDAWLETRSAKEVTSQNESSKRKWTVVEEPK